MPEFTTPLALLALTFLAGYLLGSVPFGLVWARLFGLGDIRADRLGQYRRHQRAAHRQQARGLAHAGGRHRQGRLRRCWWRARRWARTRRRLAGLAAYLGHLFPVYIGFRGGKGVATWLGTLVALAWPVGLAGGRHLAGRGRRCSGSRRSPGSTAAALAPIWALALGPPGGGGDRAAAGRADLRAPPARTSAGCCGARNRRSARADRPVPRGTGGPAGAPDGLRD